MNPEAVGLTDAVVFLWYPDDENGDVELTGTMVLTYETESGSEGEMKLRVMMKENRNKKTERSPDFFIQVPSMKKAQRRTEGSSGERRSLSGRKPH